ncbi:HNH endonuclease [Virgibacillus halodenitrificans]|uniref:HNH endonuclease n=1 Tax=Virgibacillus halodenitrificans TaxID=1482 RepID=UPI000AECFBD6
MNSTTIEPVVDKSVTSKIDNSETKVADLFTATSFRDFIMVAYNEKCAVTRNVIKYGKFMNLEAAHIQPKSHGGLFLPNNGLALSRDIHWAFDKGFFTLNEDYTLKVHSEIESDFLKGYNGKQIFIPKDSFFKPSLESIEYHRENVYGLFLTSGRL